MSVLTDRFLRCRWSDERKAIDALKKGELKIFTMAQLSNAHASVWRLNDAYEGERKYVQAQCVAKDEFTVTRTL